MAHLRTQLFALALTGPAGLPFSPQSPPTQVTLQVRSGWLPAPFVVDASQAPDVPPPPLSVTGTLPARQMPRLDLRPGAAPDLPPGPATTPGDASGPLGGPLVMIDNTAVTPAAANLGAIAEPTVAIHRDTAFYTGNWFAAVSTSAGRTWEHFSPYTAFPVADGGFSGDQVTLRVPGDDDNFMLVWILQYAPHPLTDNGRHRLAIARGRAALQQRRFYAYDLTCGTYGFPAGSHFEFPHLACTNRWLYWSTDVYDVNRVFLGSVVSRLDLDGLRRAGAVNNDVLTTTGTENAGNRLCDGTTTTMYWGRHATVFGAPFIRIGAWDDAPLATPTMRDRSISAWYGGASVSLGPDGRNWLAQEDHRVLGCYLANGALSFMWGSNAGGSFPQPFVRIAGFAPANNFVRVGEASVWNPTMAFAYPSVAADARGDVGGTMAFGGGGSHPGTMAWVVDAQSGWAPLTNALISSGGSGPTQRFGQYLWATRHPSYPNTYLGTGYALDAAGNSVPRLAWFGRQNDVPVFAAVNVTSSPMTGVPITVSVPDRNGNQDGTTNFSRTYSGVQGMTWSAPAQVIVNTTLYNLDRWHFNGVPQAQGQRDLVIANLNGVVSNTVEARYVRVQHAITVDASVAAMPFVAAPADLNGRTNGTTPGSLRYEDNVAFNVTAQIVWGGQFFDRWVVDDVPRSPGLLTVNMVATASHRLVAVYRAPTCGSFTEFGTSCHTQFPGLRHLATTTRATCGPWISDPVTYGVENATPNAAGVVFVGTSRTSWNGVPLPLPVPGQPGCSLYTDIVATISFGVGGTGAGGTGLALPNDRALVGARLFTQCLVVNALLVMQFSNGIETLIGGFP